MVRQAILYRVLIVRYNRKQIGQLNQNAVEYELIAKQNLDKNHFLFVMFLRVFAHQLPYEDYK